MNLSFPATRSPVVDRRRNDGDSIAQRIKLFLMPFDARYEDLRHGRWYLTVFRDFSAGLIVAMMAIPLAMGFAMASGLKPEQGIVGGAIAGLVGALFGGSKYQVYGPTAAFIPVIAGLMGTYTPIYGFETAHGILVTASIIAGIVLIVLGLTGMGKLAAYVPHSIVVGFTIGIAATIASSQIYEVLGIHAEPGYHSAAHKLKHMWAHLGEFNGNALLLAIVTFLLTQYLLKISIYVPAPLIAIGMGILLTGTLAGSENLTLVKTKYGQIPTDFFLITPPALPMWEFGLLKDVVYYAVVILFVSGVESLLCSRMADRLADNRGTPFNPNKEFWGQGLVQIIAPLLNGFPHTGALARTATNIKVGAVTPLAGIFKCFLKLALAFYLASYLELVPMACIGGILMWVAFNMVKPAEIKQVIAHNWFHVVLMIVTAVMVIATDFLTGVLSGMALYALLFKFCDRPPAARREIASPPSDTEKDLPERDEAHHELVGVA
jgi:MFS superfamily sulfate permease-like transporter